MTLEEIENATKLAQSLEKLELPNQLVAVLADPLLQKLLQLRPSDNAYQRIANWLHAILQDAVDGSVDEDTLWNILEVFRDFVVQTKVGIVISTISLYSFAYAVCRHYHQSC